MNNELFCPQCGSNKWAVATTTEVINGVNKKTRKFDCHDCGTHMTLVVSPEAPAAAPTA